MTYLLMSVKDGSVKDSSREYQSTIWILMEKQSTTDGYIYIREVI